MNKERRKELDRAVKLIDDIGPLLQELQEILSVCADEEREYYDNMPENMQNGDRGQVADQVASALEEAQSAAEDWNLDDLRCQIEEARDSG